MATASEVTDKTCELAAVENAESEKDVKRESLSDAEEQVPPKGLAEQYSQLDVSSDYSNISNPDDEPEPEAESQMQESKDAAAMVSVSKSEENTTPVPKGDDTKLSKSEKELNDLCANMFSKLEDYVKGEVANSVSDYALLEQMNRLTTYKYQHMLQVATSVGQSMHEINHKFSDLWPYLEQIEQIEESVLALEQAAYKLDSYAKRLEERFRKLEKR